MVTPASLYILRSFLNGSIDTLVRHAFTLAACSCCAACAACCSGVISPRPAPRRPPPPTAAGGRNHARLAGPRAHLGALGERLCARAFAATAAAFTASAAATATTATGRRAGEALDRPAHQLDRADARVDDVLQRGFGGLLRHAAIAVGDGADLHAFDERVRLRLGIQKVSAPERRGRHRGQGQFSEFTSAKHQGSLSFAESTVYSSSQFPVRVANFQQAFTFPCLTPKREPQN